LDFEVDEVLLLLEELLLLPDPPSLLEELLLLTAPPSLLEELLLLFDPPPLLDPVLPFPPAVLRPVLVLVSEVVLVLGVTVCGCSGSAVSDAVLVSGDELSFREVSGLSESLSDKLVAADVSEPDASFAQPVIKHMQSMRGNNITINFLNIFSPPVHDGFC